MKSNQITSTLKCSECLALIMCPAFFFFFSPNFQSRIKDAIKKLFLQDWCVCICYLVRRNGWTKFVFSRAPFGDISTLCHRGNRQSQGRNVDLFPPLFPCCALFFHCVSLSLNFRDLFFFFLKGLSCGRNVGHTFSHKNPSLLFLKRFEHKAVEHRGQV